RDDLAGSAAAAANGRVVTAIAAITYHPAIDARLGRIKGAGNVIAVAIDWNCRGIDGRPTASIVVRSKQFKGNRAGGREIGDTRDGGGIEHRLTHSGGGSGTLRGQRGLDDVVVRD